ncbi:MAG: hypothetical protein ACI9R3_001795 [Verrucomicrobiales bacterium]|jgi:hypothetical protein
MNSSIVTHSLWLLVTIGTFTVGSHWASRASRAPWSSDQTQGQPSRALTLTELHSRDSSTDAGTAEKTAEAAAQNGGAGEEFSLLSIITTNVSTKDLPALTKEEIIELVVASLRSSDPVTRRKAFDRLLQQMGADSFDTAQAMLMRSAMAENGANGEQWRLFDYAWGANDPAAALAHIEEISPQHRAGFTSNMLPGLASIEPHKAIDLVATMEGKEQRHMTGRLLEGLVDYNVGFATTYVEQLAQDGNPAATEYAHRLAHEVLSTSGFEAGIEWADALSDGPMQAAALQRVAHEFANKDPQAAAAWAEQYVTSEQNSRMFGEIVREWDDFSAASQWVETLEPSRAKLDAISAVYGFRGAKQPHEAVLEIVAMPPSDDRNFAINGFISGLAHQDGEAAVTWAAEITDAGMREAAMVRAGKQFFRQDSEAAIEWLAGSGLPEKSWNQVTGAK